MRDDTYSEEETVKRREAALAADAIHASAFPPPPRVLTVLKVRTRSVLGARPRRVEFVFIQRHPASLNIVIVSAARAPVADLGLCVPIKSPASLAAVNVEAVVPPGVKMLEMD